MRWPVRGYELDSRGHVNNAVYLSWAEEIATAHAEAAGYGREWSAQRGGGWVIRHIDITYHRPAVYGDEVEVTVRVELVKGVRGVRRTTIRRVSDGVLFAELLTEWVWVRLSDGGRRRYLASWFSSRRGQPRRPWRSVKCANLRRQLVGRRKPMIDAPHLPSTVHHHGRRRRQHVEGPAD